jgi:hypothetical protein
MPDNPTRRSKRDALKRHGTLNPHPDVVTDPLFQTGEFFDPGDLVQVKYEMLRSRKSGQAPSQPVRFGIRLLPSHLLSGGSRFSARWPDGVVARKTRTPPRPQAHVRRSGLPCRTPCKRSVRPPSGFGRSHSEAVRHNGSPAQHRTRAGPPGKETPLNPANGARNTAVPQALIYAYEELREQAAGSSSSGGLAWPFFLAREWWHGCRHAPGWPPLLPTTCAGVQPLAALCRTPSAVRSCWYW